MKTEVYSLTAEDIKKVAEDLQRVPKRSEEAQEVYDTLFNYFSQMILHSDFVKVVRCENCKHGKYREDYDDYECEASGCGLVNNADFYCADGDRRDTDERK